jgi:hypothetical protein
MGRDKLSRRHVTEDGATAPIAIKGTETTRLGQVPSQLWELGITELTGHNIEAHGREEVNRMLKEGWTLLHIYTLHYQDEGIWRQRPMAILGRHAPADT